jgi:CRP-like cAMP-binding protein
LKNGQILGELAFLDGSARNAIAQVSQPSILLLMQRPEFEKLAKREPHLGMVVMKNIALDLSQKIRKINSSLSSTK